MGTTASAVAVVRHDAGRWAYGGNWLAALNAGDPAGAAYSDRRSRSSPGRATRGLPPAARRMFERQYATIEVSDSVAMMAAIRSARCAGTRIGCRAPSATSSRMC